jgi:hypothetical protein
VTIAIEEHGEWKALDPDEVGMLFASAGFPWWIAGGWAMDLFLERQSRHHDDIDIGVFRSDQVRLRVLLSGWDVHVVCKGRRWEWNGESLQPSINDLWIRRDRAQPWCMQVMLNDGGGDQWVDRRDNFMRMTRSEAIHHDRQQPYLAPHIQLLFKAKDHRPKDDLDFRAAFPLLQPDEKTWLTDELNKRHPGHVWLHEIQQSSL